MLAQKRLLKEVQAITANPPQFIRAKPLETNILEFHFVIQGPPDSPFAGGWYHGVLRFPSEYPMKPPAVLMLTPSGRFEVNKKICMSMSDFHPETWNPMWSVSTILVGLLSFMLEDTKTVGSVETTVADKRAYAAASLRTNCQDATFCSLFPELVELHAQAVATAAAGGAAPPCAAEPTSTQPKQSMSWSSIIIALLVLFFIITQFRDRHDGL